MSRLFVILSFLMGVVILSSNYLVQFPIKYYDLEEILKTAINWEKKLQNEKIL